MLTQDPRIDPELVRKSKYIYEFDRDFTAKVFGYATVGAYYRDASSIDRLLNIRVPTFIVHALDDPVAVKQGIPFDEVKSNPYCFMVTTTTGGHLSWFEPGGTRWFAKPVCSHCVSRIILHYPPRALKMAKLANNNDGVST